MFIGTAKKESTAVDNPAHYAVNDVVITLEPIDLLQYYNGLIFNALKYLLRAPYKGKALEDYKKALWYLDRFNSERRHIAFIGYCGDVTLVNAFRRSSKWVAMIIDEEGRVVEEDKLFEVLMEVSKTITKEKNK